MHWNHHSIQSKIVSLHGTCIFHDKFLQHDKQIKLYFLQFSPHFQSQSCRSTGKSYRSHWSISAAPASISPFTVKRNCASASFFDAIGPQFQISSAPFVLSVSIPPFSTVYTHARHSMHTQTATATATRNFTTTGVIVVNVPLLETMERLHMCLG